jgi:cytochrome b-561 domain-containing protein 2
MMAAAFIFLMTEAIVVFSPRAALLPSASRKTKSKVHWIIQVCSGVALAVGLSAIVYNKYLNSKPHFATWHSLIGLIACVLTTVQLSCGVFQFYPNLVPFLTLKQLKILHGVSGVVAYSTGCFAVVLAFYSSWFMSKNYPLVVWYMFAISPMLLLKIIGKQVYHSQIGRIQTS